MKRLGIAMVLVVIGAVATVVLLLNDKNTDRIAGEKSQPAANELHAVVTLPSERPVLIDKSLLPLTDKSATNRVTNDMSARYVSVKNESDLRALSYVLLDVTDEDTIRHEVANLLRRSGYKELTNDLIRVLNTPEEQERFRNFAVQHIYLNYENADEKERGLIKQTLRDCLTDRHPAVQREGLLSLHRLKEPGTGATAKAWLADSDHAALHDLAIRVLRERGDKTVLPDIRNLATTENEVVAIAAIVTLGEWQDKESEQLISDLQKSESKRMQRACDLALKRIRGELLVTK